MKGGEEGRWRKLIRKLEEEGGIMKEEGLSWPLRLID